MLVWVENTVITGNEGKGHLSLSARLAQSVEHGTLTLLTIQARVIPGSWVRAPHRAITFFYVIQILSLRNSLKTDHTQDNMLETYF